MLSNAIITTACSWLGTPFHHQARVKTRGVDCLGLIIGVAQELGLKDKNGIPIASYDDSTYPRTPNGTVFTNRLTHIKLPDNTHNH